MTNSPLKIAVISDMHIGDQARAEDLCPARPAKHESHKPSSNFLENGYLDKFLDYIDENNIVADYLVIPGDISASAKPDEFELASNVIKSLASGLKTNEDNILFVPGNHDVDWDVLKIEDSTGLRKQQRYDPLKNGDIFKTTMDRSNGELLLDPYLAQWEYKDLFAFGYNSAWNDDPKTAIHHGLFDTKHLSKLGATLQETSFKREQTRLFIVHHHPFSYTNQHPHLDFSQMQNSEGLLQVLRAHQFDILIHGHKHSPKFKCSTEDSGFPIVLFGAGSFSVNLGTWYESLSNQFHLITIEGRSEEDNCIQGTVSTWAYRLMHGWHKANEKEDGVGHILPFGTYMAPHKIKDTIKLHASKTLKRKDYVSWKQIQRAHANYKFLPISTVRSLMKQACQESGYSFHETLDGELLMLRDE